MNFDRQTQEIVQALKNENEEAKPKTFLEKIFGRSQSVDPELVELAKEDVDKLLKNNLISEVACSQIKELPGRKLFEALDRIEKVIKDQGITLVK